MQKRGGVGVVVVAVGDLEEATTPREVAQD